MEGDEDRTYGDAERAADEVEEDDEVEVDDDEDDEEDGEDDDEEEEDDDEGVPLALRPKALSEVDAGRALGGSDQAAGGTAGEKRPRPAEFAASGASRWVKKWVLSGHMRVYRWVPADQSSDAPRPARTSIEDFMARMASDTTVSVLPRRRSARTNQ